jgi:hypothetical protein
LRAALIVSVAARAGSACAYKNAALISAVERRNGSFSDDMRGPGFGTERWGKIRRIGRIINALLYSTLSHSDKLQRVRP